MYSDSQKNFYTVEELKTQHKGIWDLVVKENKNFPSDDKYLICSFVEKIIEYGICRNIQYGKNNTFLLYE